MVAERIRLADLTPPIVAFFANEDCLIWSGEHKAWWRMGRAGYTTDRNMAGRYTIAGAFEHTRHCGPEKAIEFVALTDEDRARHHVSPGLWAEIQQHAIMHLVAAAEAIAWQAGVGGRETAGAIVSYLATSPDEVDPFFAGTLSPIDFAGDWMRGGRLSWHGADGKVWTPEAAAAARAARPRG